MTKHSNDAGLAFKETIGGAIGVLVLSRVVVALYPQYVGLLLLTDLVMSVGSIFALGFSDSILAIFGTLLAYYVLISGGFLNIFEIILFALALIAGLYFRFFGNNNNNSFRF